MTDNNPQDGASTPATSKNLKAPFPWFGGKSRAAPLVWGALGDVANYIEPFAGSLAVLLGRPDTHVGTTETVNDLDMYLANFWRAVSIAPDAVAYHADWPVNEADLTARHLWLVNEGLAELTANMKTYPDWYDARIAGWWVWGIGAWIGSGWCSGKGPHKYPDEDDGNGVSRKRPHLNNAGKGVHKVSLRNGVMRQLPHLDNAGKGVHKVSLRNGVYEWMDALAARLRHVRVCCGDWRRVATSGAMNHGATVGVFLDPPYHAATGRDMSLYNEESGDVSEDVRRWAIEHGDDPRLRIVLAGYDSEHAMPDTWTVVSWAAVGGYAKTNSAGASNRHRERLWLSPHCLRDDRPSLFEG